MAKTRTKKPEVTAEVHAASVKVTPPSSPDADDGSISNNSASSSTPAPTSPSPPPPSSADERPKVLCLGMSYPSMLKQLESYNVNPSEWLGGRSLITVQDVFKCVTEGMLTEMDARDLARCVATELETNVDVYTVSQEKAALYDATRHLFANFNRHSFLHQLHLAFGTDQNGNRQAQKDENISRRRSFHTDFKIQYRQAILDYFWIPQGWDDNHWSRSFFADILPALVKQGMLDMEDNNNDGVPCGVYLPFCLHVFRQVINALPLLRKFYAISFLRRKDLHEISLWKGTQTINPTKMQKKLGKHLNQENIYCTFGYQEVMEAGTSPRDEPKDVLVDILSRLEDFDEIRMLKLRPLRQHHANRNLPKEEHERGGLKGLTDPNEVLNGFLSNESGSQEEKKSADIKSAIPTTPKKPPRTPRINKKPSSSRRSETSKTATSKRKQVPSTNSPAKKKRKPTPVAPPTERRSNAKRALFRGTSLAMPTRARSRALATSSSTTLTGSSSASLFSASATPPKRSSRRHVTFVSLPANTPRKRRVSTSSAAASSRVTEQKKSPGRGGIEATNSEQGSFEVPESKTATTTPTDANAEREDPVTTVATRDHNNDAVASQEKNLVSTAAAPGVDDVLEQNDSASTAVTPARDYPQQQGPTTSPALTTSAKESEDKPTSAAASQTLDSSDSPANTAAAGVSPGLAKAEEDCSAATLAAARTVTPSPSSFLSKTSTKDLPNATAEPPARRALSFRKPNSGPGASTKPKRQSGTRKACRQQKHESVLLAASSLAAVDLRWSAQRNPPVAQKIGAKAVTNLGMNKKAEDQEPSVLENTGKQAEEHNELAKQNKARRMMKKVPVTTEYPSVLVARTKHELSEVSDGTTSSCNINDSETTISMMDSDDEGSIEVVSVLERLEQPNPAIIPRDSGISTAAFDFVSLPVNTEEPGLTTKHRLEHLKSELDPARRSLKDAPTTVDTKQKARTIVAPTKTVVMKKAGKRTKDNDRNLGGRETTHSLQNLPAPSKSRTKQVAKLPRCSRNRRKEWKARKGGRGLKRKSGGHPEVHTIRTASFFEFLDD